MSTCIIVHLRGRRPTVKMFKDFNAKSNTFNQDTE